MNAIPLLATVLNRTPAVFSTIPAPSAAAPPALLAALEDPTGDPRFWYDLLPAADAAFDRFFKRIQARVRRPKVTSPIDVFILALMRAMYERDARSGDTSIFDVAFVARDPIKPIIYFYTTDGRVIGYSPEARKIPFIRPAFGFDPNFFRDPGFFSLEEFVVLFLPSGESILFSNPV